MTQLDAFDGTSTRGDQVEVRLCDGTRAVGTVTAVDSHRCPHAPYSPLLWVEIEDGPGWAEGDEFSFYAHTTEAA